VFYVFENNITAYDEKVNPKNGLKINFFIVVFLTSKSFDFYTEDIII